MSTRARAAAFTGVSVLVIAVAVGYVLVQRRHQDDAQRSASPVSQLALSSVVGAPRVVFRNTALGATYGEVAMVPLSDPGGPRAITGTSCDRVYAASDRLLCLASSRGLVTTYSAEIYDASAATKELPLPLTGLPSRARLSADGRLAATTTFVTGDSYASTAFSTRTVISRLGGTSYGSLEGFALHHDGATIAPVDRNFWGVTFAAGDDTFYATAEWGQHTWLVRGNLSDRTLTTLVEDAECPSLSPDGRTIVFKRRGNLPSGQWRLVGYDVATGRTTPLAETRSVDDQVAWLDDATVLYGLPRTGSQSAIDDVWRVPADGSGRPSVFIREAWSPAVVR